MNMLSKQYSDTCQRVVIVLGVLRTCNGAEYQVKIFLSMPIYAFHGAILWGISAGGYAVYCYLNGVHDYLHR